MPSLVGLRYRPPLSQCQVWWGSDIDLLYHHAKFGRAQISTSSITMPSLVGLRYRPPLSPCQVWWGSYIDLLYHHAKFGGAQISTSSITMPSLVGLRYRAPQGAKKFDVFFCLFVTLLDNKVCECHFAINALEFGNETTLLSLDSSMFLDMHPPAFNFVSATLGGATTEWQIWKKTEKWGFFVYQARRKIPNRIKFLRVSAHHGSTQASQIWRGSV